MTYTLVITSYILYIYIHQLYNSYITSVIYYAVAKFVDWSSRRRPFPIKIDLTNISRYIFMNKVHSAAATKEDGSVASGENGIPHCEIHIHHQRYNWESLRPRIYILAAAAGTQSSRLSARPADEGQTELIHFRIISGSPGLLCPRRDTTNFSSISAAAISRRTKLLRLSAYIARPIKRKSAIFSTSKVRLR